MIPKKIYLNYVDENDADKTWSEEPISVSDCKMKNREYTDLSQVWHHFAVVPTESNKDIIYSTYCGEIYVGSMPKGLGDKLTINKWYEFAACEAILFWAYADDLLPKGGTN